MMWTNEARRRVAEMLRRDMTAREISDVLGVSRRSVISIVWRDPYLRSIGFSHKPGGEVPVTRKQVNWTDHKRDLVLALYLDGYTHKQIGKIFGVSESSISGLMNRMRQASEGKEVKAPQVGKKVSPIREQRVRSYGWQSGGPRLKKVKIPSTAYPAPDSIGVSMTDLRAFQCRWPINDAKPGEEHLFCGAKAFTGSYCPHHAEMSRGSGTPSEQKAISEALRVAA